MKNYNYALIALFSLISISAAQASEKEIIRTDSEPSTVQSTTVQSDPGLGTSTTVNSTTVNPDSGKTVIKKKSGSHHLLNLGLIKVL